MKFSLVSWSMILLAACIAGPASGAVLSADAEDLSSVARQLAVGSSLVLDEVELKNPSDRLVLERFEVFAPDAEIVVHGASGTNNSHPVPDNAYFQGSIAGDPGSRAVLSVRGDGSIRGLVESQGEYWVLAGGESAAGPSAGIATRKIDAAAELTSEFSCATDELVPPAGDVIEPPAPLEALVPPAAFEGAGPSYTARIALETDYEYFQRLGSVGAAIDYAAELVAYASTIYSAEVDTSMLLSYISLWTTPSDPWNQSSTSCNLFHFGQYWNSNRSQIDRTLAHFLSGRSLGGGIAWVGVLCNGGFSYNIGGGCPGLASSGQYGGDYGFSAGITGSFDLDNPRAVWDIVVVTHEIGHNFNSPHSHCYEGLGGNSDPVDECYSGQCGQGGCYCGATSLPGPPSSGSGTIMSYCHLLGGGLNNVALTLGEGHPYGVAPERIPDRMNAHVVTQALANPGCLSFVDDLISTDSFDFGLGGWTETDPDGNLTATNAAAIAPGSSQGIAVVKQAGNQTPAYLTDDSPTAEPRYRVRFWYDPNSITMEDNKRHKIGFLFGTTPSQRRLLTFVVRKDPGGAYRLLAKAHADDGSWAKTAWVALSDAPHMIEADWRRATAPGTNDGSLRLWLDGNLAGTVTGIDNDGWLGELFRLGNVGGLDPGTSGTQYFDDFRSHRMSYIGD